MINWGEKSTFELHLQKKSMYEFRGGWEGGKTEEKNDLNVTECASVPGCAVDLYTVSVSASPVSSPKLHLM